MSLDELIEVYENMQDQDDIQAESMAYLKEYRQQRRYMVKLIRLLRNITWDFDYSDHPLIYGNDVQSSLWDAYADDVWRKE